jgi:hypothetical protein
MGALRAFGNWHVVNACHCGHVISSSTPERYPNEGKWREKARAFRLRNKGQGKGLVGESHEPSLAPPTRTNV